jgi:hypothetical protein
VSRQAGWKLTYSGSFESSWMYLHNNKMARTHQHRCKCREACLALGHVQMKQRAHAVWRGDMRVAEWHVLQRGTTSTMHNS